MTQEQATKLNELMEKQNKVRAQIIEKYGDVIAFTDRPEMAELTELSRQIVDIMFNGAEKVSISYEQVVAWSEK